jgi:sporadic carbohydrate cluster protein (TIGR04323 family)
MKKARGYIFSRKFLGERIPQSIQNLAIRDYCSRNNIMYLLSATEYAMKNSSKVLFKIINEINKEGIILYSLFQLPNESSQRDKIYKTAIKNKKKICFALENRILNNKDDIQTIEDIWNIKEVLPNCLKKI